MRRYLALSERATSPGPRRHRRRHAPDLAGIRLAVPAAPRSASAWPRSPRSCRRASTLITGAARADEPLPGESGRRVLQRILVVGDDGTILGPLRQDPPRAVRRVLSRSRRVCCAARACASSCTCPAASSRAPRRMPAGAAACPPSPPTDLLRGDLPRRGSCPEGAPGPDPQRHQRRLVRRHAGTAPALRTGPAARRRGGPAAGARRQQRRLGRHRPLRPDPAAAPLGRRACSTRAAGALPPPSLRVALWDMCCFGVLTLRCCRICRCWYAATVTVRAAPMGFAMRVAGGRSRA